VQKSTRGQDAIGSEEAGGGGSGTYLTEVILAKSLNTSKEIIYAKLLPISVHGIEIVRLNSQNSYFRVAISTTNPMGFPWVRRLIVHPSGIRGAWMDSSSRPPPRDKLMAIAGAIHSSPTLDSPRLFITSALK
jgi:hypothetical protein